MGIAASYEGGTEQTTRGVASTLRSFVLLTLEAFRVRWFPAAMLILLLTLALASPVMGLMREAGESGDGASRPSAQTLVWWKTSARTGPQAGLSESSERVLSNGAVALLEHYNPSPVLATIGRASVLAISRGLGCQGELCVREGDEPAAVPRARAVVDVGPDNQRATDFVDALLGADAPVGAATIIEGVSARPVQSKGWASPLLVGLHDGRLLFASDEEQFRAALGLGVAGAGEDTPELAGEDLAGHLKASAERAKGVPAEAVVYVNVNALRRARVESFSSGAGAKILAAWRVQNARGLALHLRSSPSQAATRTSPGHPVLLGLDLTLSARSEPLGFAKAHAIAIPEMFDAKRTVAMTDVRATMTVRASLPVMMDWCLRTYRATLDDEKEKAFAPVWKNWLTRNRSAIAEVNRDVESQIVLGFESSGGQVGKGSGGGGVGLLPFRLLGRTGRSPTAAAARLGDLATPAGAASSPLGPEQACWSVPITMDWLSGRLAWTGREADGLSIIDGAFGIAKADPCARLEALSKPAQSPAREAEASPQSGQPAGK